MCETRVRGSLPEELNLREGPMVGAEVWGEINRLFGVERWSKSKIVRELGVDVKTVWRCLKQEAWRPYERKPREATLLAEHAEFLRRPAPEVGYSAQILFQELVGSRGYAGSYETVKRFVRPLQVELRVAERAAVRFETPPGLQSQIDWGERHGSPSARGGRCGGSSC